MKKTIIAGVVLAFSLTSVFASIDTNLKYGMKGDQVSELQEFLNDKGLLTTNSTGFFGLMTLKAVKAYQVSQNLPATGYVGVLSRKAINDELSAIVASSTEAEVAETGTSTPLDVNTGGVPLLIQDIPVKIEKPVSVTSTSSFPYTPEMEAFDNTPSISFSPVDQQTYSLSNLYEIKVGRIEIHHAKFPKIKEIKYSIISTDYSLSDIPVEFTGGANFLITNKGTTNGISLYTNTPINQFYTPVLDIKIPTSFKAITKTGTFKVRIDSIVLTSINEDTDYPLTVDGFISPDIVITQ